MLRIPSRAHHTVAVVIAAQECIAHRHLAPRAAATNAAVHVDERVRQLRLSRRSATVVEVDAIRLRHARVGTERGLGDSIYGHVDVAGARNSAVAAGRLCVLSVGARRVRVRVHAVERANNRRPVVVVELNARAPLAERRRERLDASARIAGVAQARRAAVGARVASVHTALHVVIRRAHLEADGAVAQTVVLEAHIDGDSPHTALAHLGDV
mmetsp:Transcript_49232/g.120755  ORF Transcript_49232/g.120755 Transcript_49232/m.120755 type:complete len:212 (-) Transcript_49232:773-1408(-)